MGRWGEGVSEDSSSTPGNQGKLPGGGDPAATWKRKACAGHRTELDLAAKGGRGSHQVTSLHAPPGLPVGVPEGLGPRVTTGQRPARAAITHSLPRSRNFSALCCQSNAIYSVGALLWVSFFVFHLEGEENKSSYFKDYRGGQMRYVCQGGKPWRGTERCLRSWSVSCCPYVLSPVWGMGGGRIVRILPSGASPAARRREPPTPEHAPQPRAPALTLALRTLAYAARQTCAESLLGDLVQGLPLLTVVSSSVTGGGGY